MVLDLSLASVITFFTIMSLLVIYSILDFRERRVSNEFVIGGIIVSCIVITLTSHFTSNILLHITALALVVPLVYVLFRIGSIGGADAKVLFVLALTSPGIELVVWSEPVLEAIIALGGELVVMLLGGYFYWRFRGMEQDSTPPLIPFLLVGYLAIQLFAIF